MRTYVLDANALITYLDQRPGSDKIGHLLKQALRSDKPLLMSVVNWGEVFYTIWHGRGETKARQAMFEVSRLPIRFVAADLTCASAAAELKARHGVPYADCFAAAVALLSAATIVTSDPDFQKFGQPIPILRLPRA